MRRQLPRRGAPQHGRYAAPGGGVTPHLVAACLNAGDFGSIPGPSANIIPRSASTRVVPAGGVSVGSGKSDWPFARMHAANLKAACRSLSDIVGGPPLNGAYRLHACWAAWNAGDFAEPGGMLIPPPGLGSGKLGTPCERMHWASSSPKSGFVAPSLLEDPQAASANALTKTTSMIERSRARISAPGLYARPANNVVTPLCHCYARFGILVSGRRRGLRLRADAPHR